MSEELKRKLSIHFSALLSILADEALEYQQGTSPTLASADSLLMDWLLNASNFGGDFLKDIATAGLRADWENYPLLRPFLIFLKNKYSEYAQPYTGIRPKR
jgi:hypothetical protein